MQGDENGTHEERISVVPMGDGVGDLIAFLTSGTWEYHGVPNPAPESIASSYESGAYDGEDTKTFWVLDGNGTRLGLIRVFDLGDPTPLFDIRVHHGHRGMGFGTLAVKWLVRHIFESYPDKDRIEGYTRRDNMAMRRVFRKCGFVKEAHHRRAWGSADGRMYDAIGYAILREDWMTGVTTPVDWKG